jgi:hypothetical protein
MYGFAPGIWSIGPFKGRRNPLTPRQVRARKRLLKRVKR